MSQWLASTTSRRGSCATVEMLIDTLIDAVESGEGRNSLLPVHLTVRESSVSAGS